ncbi:hypothetical protein EVAR_35217_1 [Eumeta japonica]|uniref:Uncharacterized protein n=1 Tax=Eumeta variegata TaxID=151549 RepID=A0A4C1VDC2_EUMVA|nr:hypothetical protein EVAR_35217_1 [Eumeta japonica]
MLPVLISCIAFPHRPAPAAADPAPHVVSISREIVMKSFTKDAFPFGLQNVENVLFARIVHASPHCWREDRFKKRKITDDTPHRAGARRVLADSIDRQKLQIDHMVLSSMSLYLTDIHQCFHASSSVSGV